MHKAVVFSGTTEGRELSAWLARQGVSVTVCTVGTYALELMEETLKKEGLKGLPGVRLISGGLDADGMVRLLGREQPGLVIDATHPYAAAATENIRCACRAYPQVLLLRCQRGESFTGDMKGEAVRSFAAAPDAVKALSGTVGNILMTTGVKELKAFACLEGFAERVYARVLPLESSIGACRALGLKGRHILGMQGPFSEELNRALLLEYHCGWLVTKDGGEAGGFDAKARAAAAVGATLIVLERPRDEGLRPDEVKVRVQQWLGQSGGTAGNG